MQMNRINAILLSTNGSVIHLPIWLHTAIIRTKKQQLYSDSVISYCHLDCAVTISYIQIQHSSISRQVNGFCK